MLDEVEGIPDEHLQMNGTYETLPSAVEELIRRRQERQEPWPKAVRVEKSNSAPSQCAATGSPSEKEIAPCESS